jgi:hypothetical protein
MNSKLHKFGNIIINEIISDEIIINDIQDALDLMVNANAKKIILKADNLDPKFFDLNTCFAGDVLQKFTNYQVDLAIIGDYSKYKSKSLKDFIYESNKTGNIVFVNSTEEAIKLLTKK